MSARTVWGTATALALVAVATSAGMGGVAHAGAAGPRLAATGQGLAAVKSACAAAVTNRESELTLDVSRIGAFADLSSSDRSALLADEHADASGLTAVNASVQASTTVGQALTECGKIVTDYYVYVLYTPQLLLVGSADSIAKLDASAEAALPQLDRALKSNTNPTIKSALSDLTKQLNAARTSVSGVSASALGETAANYPSGGVATLRTDQAALLSAVADLTHARADLETIQATLGSST